MVFRVNVAFVILALAAGGVTLPVEPAKAQGLFERIFKPSPRYRQRDRQFQRNRKFQKQQAIEEARKVRISGPRYYAYKPDKMINASFSSLAEVDTASNDPSLVPAVVTTPFANASAHLSDFRVRTLVPVAGAVKSHYLAKPEFIWISDGKVNTKAREAMAVLAEAGKYGLSPSDYQVLLPASVPIADGDDPDKRLIEFEIQLSTKILTYVFDAKRGRIDPNRISGYHDFKRKTVDLDTVMSIVASTDGLVSYLESRSPDNVEFSALAVELAKLRSAGNEQRIEIAEGTFLKPGRPNPEVANIVAAIRLRGSEALKTKHGDTLANYEGGDAYSKDLVALVRDFQRESGLKPDGIVGKATIRAMTSDSAAVKIAKVELAMERLRWLPRELGDRHVFINQPAFKVTYMHKGKDPLSMRVVVGKKSNQTNFFMDKLETVEYNPYWGVPRSIIVNEMLPKLYEDPSYLDRLGYEVSTASGRQISSSSVDWFDVGANGAPINVRQRPGRRNALGELKILFPNKHAIYMHDTPAKSLFKKDRRAYSHGCVRLQDPRAMAAAVLDKSTDYIASRIAGGRNDADKVKADISVYVAYFTAWPTPEGTVEYFDDMYARDKYLTRALEKTSMSRNTNG